MIKQFTHYGYSYSDSASIGTAYAGFAVTADATNSPTSAAFPDDCFIDSIEFEASGIASGENVTVYLARDSGGLVPITTDQLAGATQAPTLVTGATTSGGYTFTVGKDFHFDPSVANTTRGTLYVFAKVATGAITANIRVNWRS
jgi:hypothetical protein